MGSKIRALRIDAKDSQLELANKLGVSRSFLAMVERDNREFGAEHLAQIADIYNVDMNYLYGKQAEANSHRIVSEREFSIIKAYRNASPEVRAIIDGIVERQ
jgi:transcriptional regulator with XRE-family HTH domain